MALAWFRRLTRGVAASLIVFELHDRQDDVVPMDEDGTHLARVEGSGSKYFRTVIPFITSWSSSAITGGPSSRAGRKRRAR